MKGYTTIYCHISVRLLIHYGIRRQSKYLLRFQHADQFHMMKSFRKIGSFDSHHLPNNKPEESKCDSHLFLLMLHLLRFTFVLWFKLG